MPSRHPELLAVTVTNNRVRERVLNPGRPEWGAFPPLPYETEVDRWTARRRRRRPRPREDNVVALGRG